MLGAFSAAHGTSHFPVNVEQVALSCHELFGWSDPIKEIQAAGIKGFEGCLFPNDKRDQWMLLYNDAMNSPGRVRFTQAHEIGHYILHRFDRDSFQCTDASNMRNVSNDDQDLEKQADEFASYLLMPLDDFRKQFTAPINFDLLGHCTDRYGVSMTAAILKWIAQTEEKAVFIMSNDGFINWAWSSDAAFKAGAFFKTRGNTIEVPKGSLAADQSIQHNRLGINVAANVWFKHADPGLSLREMKINAGQYGHVLTLLCLPSIARVWSPGKYD